MSMIRMALGQKWQCFGKHFQAKGLSVAHSLYYIVPIYNTVGDCIASISDLNGIFTSGRKCWL